jgi:hypothetical protein
MAGLDWTADRQSWTGRAQSRPVHAGDVTGRSISHHHHHHSVWQGEADVGRTEIQVYWKWTQRWGVYIWETPGQIDIILLYNEIHTLSFPAHGPMHSCLAFIDPHNLCGSSCTLAQPSSIHPSCVVFYTWVAYHILSPSSYHPQASTALSHEFPLDAVRGEGDC